MIQNFDLKTIEKRAWVSFFQTGLADLSIGLIFVVGTVCMIFGELRYYLMSLYLIPIILFFIAMRTVIMPRQGIVKFSRRRRIKSGILFAVLTTVLVTSVLLTAFGKSRIIPQGLSAQSVIVFVILSICVSVGYFLNFNRMYIYGFLISAAFILSEIIRANPGFISKGGTAYLIPAVVMISTGTVNLIRFLRKYPIPEDGSGDAG